MHVYWRHIRTEDKAREAAKELGIRWPTGAKALTLCVCEATEKARDSMEGVAERLFLDDKTIGYAVCGKRDMFSRPRARQISMGRMLKKLPDEYVGLAIQASKRHSRPKDIILSDKPDPAGDGT